MSVKNEYQVLTDFDTVVQVLSALRRSKKTFSFDLETTSLSPFRGHILGCGFSWKEHTGIYIPFHIRDISFWAGELRKQWAPSEEEQILSLMRDLFEQEEPVKIAHNASFEYAWLRDYWHINLKNLFCTFYYHFIKHQSTEPGYETKIGLEALAKAYKDQQHLKDIWEGVKENEFGDKDLSLYHNTEKIGVYCCGDCDVTLREYNQAQKDIVGKPYQLLLTKRNMPSVSFVSRMSRTGFLVDRDYLIDTRAKLKVRKQELLGSIREQVQDDRFNPGSVDHIASVFVRRWKAPVLGKGNFDDTVLRAYKMQHGFPVAGDILEYRQVSKLISTYFDNIERSINPVTGRVHANFKLWGARTGRLSCSDPNLQNLPVRVGPLVKRMFIAAPGHQFAGGDYSQIELRIIAVKSQDPVLMDAFRRGIDTHKLTASFLYGIRVEDVSKVQRNVTGKTANFAWCYGGGPSGLVYGSRGLGNKVMGVEYAEKLGVDYEELDSIVIDDKLLISKAKELRDRYFSGYKRILPWGQEVVARARQRGYVVSSYGRVLYLPNIKHRDDSLRQHAERQAVNLDPQSTASDFQIFHMMEMQNSFDKLSLNVEPVGTVHDQFIYEVPEDCVDKVKKIIEIEAVLEDESNLQIPMVVEPVSGTNLSEL